MTSSRRTVLKGGVAAAAAGGAILGSKQSRAFAVPNIISQTGSTVEINFWYGLGGAIGERINELIEEFNGLNNGVRVTGLQQTSYDETGQNLTLALQDGTFPDVVLLSEVWWFRFYLANKLLPMDDLIASTGYDINDVVDSLRVEGYRAGQHWWLPVARSTPLMYYNKTMYEEAGITAPAATWSELREIGPALSDPDAQIYGLGFYQTLGDISWHFHGATWAFGGNYSTPDFKPTITEQGAVDAGELWRTAVADGWAAVSADQESDFVNSFIATGFFSTGMLTSLTAQAEEAGFELGTAFLPGELPGITATCPTGGSGLALLASDSPERQAAAFSFFAHWSSPERTAAWSEATGYMPVRKSAIAGPAVQQLFAEKPNYKVAVDQLQTRTQPQDVIRRLVAPGAVIIGEAITASLINQIPAAEAFATAAQQLSDEAAPVVAEIIAKEGDLTSGAATPPGIPATPAS
ncbi:MAG TPA: ABC transporter substrate-binding protein [Thermomicrobiales bacterium]|nr:ABC transporter substrate-binding protein [Thermomicrobiales bacterium]